MPLLFALDLDGTLLNPAGEVEPEDAAAVAEALDAGHRLIIATARPPRISRPIGDALGLAGPMVHYNGALLTGDGGVVLDRKPLDPDVAHAAAAAARARFPHVVVDVEVVDDAGRDCWHTDRTDARWPTRISATAEPHVAVDEGDLYSLFSVTPTKLLLRIPPEEREALHGLVRDVVGTAAATAVSDAHMLQLMHPAASKAAGVADAAGRLGVPRADVVAVGDAPNDAPMLAWAGVGVAVGHAWPEARDAADVTAPDGAGVAWAIRHGMREPRIWMRG